ncbi:hypothetical protein GOODEAATRI_030130 [Goodea atripinnis]|uniref:Secreted protein n=1 Tax=Goodea atripinnis TaxID=208336 RepID=A0ABV0N5D9_9TELE
MGSRTTALLWKRLSFHLSHCFRVTTTAEFVSVSLLTSGPFDPKLATYSAETEKASPWHLDITTVGSAHSQPPAQLWFFHPYFFSFCGIGRINLAKVKGGK